MTLYTLDKHTYSRRLLDPTVSDINEMIEDGGNMKSMLVGNDEFSMPIIECIYKPRDSDIHGVRWITKDLTD